MFHFLFLFVIFTSPFLSESITSAQETNKDQNNDSFLQKRDWNPEETQPFSFNGFLHESFSANDTPQEELFTIMSSLLYIGQWLPYDENVSVNSKFTSKKQP